MTRYAICGPVRHAFYVIERLKRQGIAQEDIHPVLTRSDRGNSARTQIELGGDDGTSVTWTEDSRYLLAANVPDEETLSGQSPTPVHAIFNMFWQNAKVAAELPANDEVITRMRSDMILYDGCLSRLREGQTGLARNPIARDSGHVSDQFMAIESCSYARIWAIEGFADLFRVADGIPESMIRHRVRTLSYGEAFAFERFVDFDLIYEDTRWSDSPRIYWTKVFLDWQACYAAPGRKGPITHIFDKLHVLTMSHASVLRKAANLALKILYLPVFALELPRIANARRSFPVPPVGGDHAK